MNFCHVLSIMKTNYLILILIISLFSLTTNSQITKGNWMVGGDAYFYNFETIKDNVTRNSSSIWISPNFGYFIKNQFAIGSKIEMNFIKNGSDNYTFTPFTRYYFIKPNKMINYFLEARAGYGFGISKYDNSKYYLNKYGLKSGIVVFLNQSVGFEFSLDYLKTNHLTRKDKTNLLKIGFGLQIYLKKDR